MLTVKLTKIQLTDPQDARATSLSSSTTWISSLLTTVSTPSTLWCSHPGAAG